MHFLHGNLTAVSMAIENRLQITLFEASLQQAGESMANISF
jgi:hypothetical protein